MINITIVRFTGRNFNFYICSSKRRRAES